jgi:hypothetical protein
MTAMKRTMIGLALSFALFEFANTALAADNGLITEQSRYSVNWFGRTIKDSTTTGFVDTMLTRQNFWSAP